MKVGITSYGAYIPYSRISRTLIAQAWERGAVKGERSVAGTDEDAVTMAVEAVRRCLKPERRAAADGLYFASVTAPYAEKSHAALVATACDLREDVFTADLGCSPKCSADALRMALDAAAQGRETVAVGADCRKAWPKSDKEQLLGDAAAAIVAGTEGVIAELLGFASVNNEITDVWRNHSDEYVRTGEGRFIATEGYTASMLAAVKKLLKNVGREAEGIDRFVFCTPDLKSHLAIGKKLGVSPEKILDPMMLTVGDCGSAQALLLLAAALEGAKSGETILLAAYGNGADAFLFCVTDEIEKAVNGSVAHFLNARRELGSYAKFLSFQNSLHLDPGDPFRTFPSNAGTWRERSSILRFHGSRCKKCGEVIFPINRVCNRCGTVDAFEEVAMQDRISKVFTYTIDRLAGRGDDPVVVQTVTEDAEGCRFYVLMTDFEQSEVRVGMEVEFCFRRIYEGGNTINYFWKCRPVRK